LGAKVIDQAESISAIFAYSTGIISIAIAISNGLLAGALS
jgi:hypothetical protein